MKRRDFLKALVGLVGAGAIGKLPVRAEGGHVDPSSTSMLVSGCRTPRPYAPPQIVWGETGDYAIHFAVSTDTGHHFFDGKTWHTVNGEDMAYIIAYENIKKAMQRFDVHHT